MHSSFHVWKHILYLERSGICFKKIHQRDFLYHFHIQNFYSCLSWTETWENLNRNSCKLSVVSIQRLENPFLVSNIFHLISLFNVVIFQLFHSITSFKSRYPIHFLCSFVSSIQQFSFHLETAVSTAFFFHFWWKRFHCDSKLFYRS